MTETNIALWGDRHLPLSAVAEMAKGLEASGVVDGILLADQITNFLPRQLWTAENTPMAHLMGDPDSHSDVWVLAGYLMAHAPSLALSVSTDSVRNPPAELVQRMLTLANLTEGRATFHVGGGEVKQCKPFGHKRSQGMSRMEDLFRIFGLLMEADGPIDYDGRRWTFRKATIGGARQHRPQVWALGAGPQLIDHATSYADGLAVTCPPVWGSAERFGEERLAIRAQLEAKGRDPDEFRFGVWFPVLLTAGDEMFEHALDNPLVRWMSGMFGRIDATQWKEVGLESPVPEDWNYFMEFLPYDTDDAFVADVLSKTTREHVTQCWLSGTPEQVAEMIQPYVEAGADWVCPMDYMPLVLSLEEAAAAFARSIELCGLIKSRQPSPV